MPIYIIIYIQIHACKLTNITHTYTMCITHKHSQVHSCKHKHRQHILTYAGNKVTHTDNQYTQTWFQHHMHNCPYANQLMHIHTSILPNISIPRAVLT